MTQVAEKIEEPEAIQYYGFKQGVYENYIFGLELLRDSIEEIRQIHAQHWDETEVLYLTRPMDPDYEMIASMEANRQFLFFSIRDENAKLIGNFGYYIAPSTHFKDMTIAREDFFFIEKSHRGGHLAAKFYQYTEECLIQLGVKLIGISDKAPCGGKSLKPLLSREGFKEVSTIYMKEIL